MKNKPPEFGKQISPPGSTAGQSTSAKAKLSRGNWMVTLPLAAAAVAYVMLGFLPGRKAIAELQQQIQEKQDYMAQTASVAPALLAAQQQLEQAKACNAAWSERAPDRAAFSALYGRIYELANQAGATTTRFDPDPLVELQRITKVPISVGLSGTFAQLYEFLRGLDGLPMSIWVENVHVEKKDGGGEVASCEISLVVFADNPENSDYAGQSR